MGEKKEPMERIGANGGEDEQGKGNSGQGREKSARGEKKNPEKGRGAREGKRSQGKKKESSKGMKREVMAVEKEPEERREAS